MAEEILYQEKQRFTQWWLYAFLLIPVGFMISKVMKDEIMLESFVIEGSILLVLVSLIFFLQLKTTITTKGILINFFPLVLKEKMILWQDVQSASVRIYSPMGEYGGWGLRYSTGNGKAYNVRGNEGLQLVFKGGRKLLIGTQKSQELKLILEKINLK